MARCANDGAVGSAESINLFWQLLFVALGACDHCLVASKWCIQAGIENWKVEAYRAGQREELAFAMAGVALLRGLRALTDKRDR